MSDPVTNVEIEDVLSSIRRLVSDGDKARSREAASAAVAITQAEELSAEEPETAESASSRFVLTPALMVVDGDVADESTRVEVEDGTDDGWFRSDDDADGKTSEVNDADTAPSNVAETENHDQDEKTSQHDVTDGPLELTNMVWGPLVVEDGKSAEDEAQPEPEILVEEATQVEPAATSPDRSELVASITELEAAIGGGAEEYEPDGSEVMGQTIAWPGAVARSFEDVEDAQVDAQDETPEGSHEPLTEDNAQESGQTPGHDEANGAESSAGDVYEDDDLDGLLEAGGVALDEEALRALVSEVVREELTGPLGERITRNVRKLVRREIYRILSSQEFD